MAIGYRKELAILTYTQPSSARPLLTNASVEEETEHKSLTERPGVQDSHGKRETDKED
jgi:hypothetical protein